MFLTSRKRFIAMAYGILQNQQDAEDAVQNAGLSAFNNLRTFEGRSALKTWFTRIVLNSALMIRRKRKSTRNVPLPETGDDAWTEHLPALEPDPEFVYAEGETLQRIETVLAKMRPTLKQAFTLTYYDELSPHEACALMGISRGTFKSRLFRARKYMVKRMSPSAARFGKRTPLRFSSGQTAFHPFADRTGEISSAGAVLS
jgi:RNA polymerase sigma-70 factor (ECF subfamily)